MDNEVVGGFFRAAYAEMRDDIPTQHAREQGKAKAV